MSTSIKIIGTYIWYYCICKREVWLMSRSINPFEQDENLEIGRFLHENTYEREKKEIEINGMRIDIIKNNKGKIIIGEIKKSSSYIDSSRMQLLFYLKQLEREGIAAEGVLLFPEERKRERIVLNDESRRILNDIQTDIYKIISCEIPPPPLKVKFCSKCAYREMCWA